MKRCMTCGEPSEHGFCPKHRDTSIYEMPQTEDVKRTRGKAAAHGCIKRFDKHGGIHVASSQIPTSLTRRPCYSGKPVGKTSDGQIIREVGKGLTTVGGAKVIENQSQRERWNEYERTNE
jgi:hypothetical protein